MRLANLRSRWVRDVPLRNFRFGGGATSRAFAMVDLECRHKNVRFTLRLSVVPGKTPLLISKPALKQMGAVLDMSQGSLQLKALGLNTELREHSTSGHYTLDLCERASGNEKSPLDTFVGVNGPEDQWVALVPEVRNDPFVTTVTSGFQ